MIESKTVNLIDEEVPWEQIVSDIINEWMTLFAIANFIPKKLLLSAMLGVLSTLVRKTQIEGTLQSVHALPRRIGLWFVKCMLICMHSAYQMDRKGMQWNGPHYYR